eukprot:CAMPEP_0202859510 /NCGR_PEP_ID=MMETSP1391-20130828/1587_1 /ASSEMBLY_ACC=CAM_ASM_000867 /TAXON_ID=1034604 /ORGANISM="Chlamydomonas leiostraca, Strain SAG 11-49" /LENGTH=381 /DNA_ID=CAMNT_0049538545 /DNA_START=147 /DNA_END=1292 /DNA_ORIENTATION=+
MSVEAFQAVLHEKTGVAPSQQEILCGFPPKQAAIPADASTTPLSSLPIQNGDTITVRAAPTPPQPPAPTPAPTPAPAPATSSASHQPPQPPAAANHQFVGDDMDEDPELAMAIAASLADQPGPSAAAPAAAPKPTPSAPARSTADFGYSHPVAAGASHSGGSAKAGPAPTSMPTADGSAVTRRVVNSDNSCLFNAVGYVMDRSRDRQRELRQVIATAVRGDPFTFNEGFLGASTEDYCKFILDPTKWGGAIELAILSAHYAREIAAFDIQTCRCDVYGQDAGYSERVMLLYDGLHYDAMAAAAYDGAPEELDVTIYTPGTPAASDIEAAAARLVKAIHDARQFTDTANFTLRCGVCQVGLKGEKEAVEHAKATGHQNFTEY